MKNLGIVLAVLGGVAAGAAMGMLFAPQKGSDTRAYIKKMLKNKGICCCDKDIDEIVDELSAK